MKTNAKSLIKMALALAVAIIMTMVFLFVTLFKMTRQMVASREMRVMLEDIRGSMIVEEWPTGGW
ncbi:MAG: hypothetical protein J5921_03135, partial [Clostridia bacterium]|nr:hypothetical protein [Clostridia bacterium]